MLDMLSSLAWTLTCHLEHDHLITHLCLQLLEAPPGREIQYPGLFQVLRSEIQTYPAAAAL